VQNNTLIAYELLQAELYKTALPLLDGVIAQNDEYFAAYMYKGICYLKLGDLNNAKKDLELATTVSPDEIDPWIFLAQIYVEENNQKSAVDSFEQALTIDKTNETVRYDFAQVLKGFNLYQQASLEYLDLIELETVNSPKYKLEIAELYIDHLEKIDDGFAYMQSITEEWSDFQNASSEFQAQAIDMLGWAHLKRGEKDQALNFLKQAQEIYPYLATTYYHLGILYKEIENRSEATLAFERAIDLDTSGEISALASKELEEIKK